MELSDLRKVENINKSFITDIDIFQHPEIFKGVLTCEDNLYQVSEQVIDTLCKKSGISTTINNILRSQNEVLWKDTVLSLYKYYYKEGKVSLLLEDGVIRQISFRSPRPLLNQEFFSETYSTFSDYSDLVSLEYFTPNISGTNAEILLFHTKVFEYNRTPYRVGVLLTNDELSRVSATLAIDFEGMIFYLPSKYYNVTSSRYTKTAQDASEAYRLMLLKIISDMSTENWFSVVPEISMHISNCHKLPLTYEEYRKADRLLHRAAVLSDMEGECVDGLVSSLKEAFFDFEENYPMLEDKRGSYIWRCSALSDHTAFHLLTILKDIINTQEFYPEALVDIRQTIGEFIVCNKISTELAKKGR